MESRHSIRRVTMLWAIAATSLATWHAPALADAPRDTIPAAIRDANARARIAFDGTPATTKLALPGSTAGLVIRPQAKVPLRTKDARRRIYDDGQAYAENARVTVTDVFAKKREIVVMLGYGGYDPRTLKLPAPGTAGFRELNAEFQMRAIREGWTAIMPTGGGWVTESATVNPDVHQRELEEQHREATHQRELAEANASQMERARVARSTGTRLHFVFDHDVTPDMLAEDKVRELVAPYLTLGSK